MRLVILFGSSRGDFTEGSDYDVLVVGDEIPKDPTTILRSGSQLAWGSSPMHTTYS
jgi:predicted nucleotidyltransferase